ncbi:unnamed protein product [Candidula unifasciata]|uniref:MalT-like TPR region domain-containing protein n=1 Tax=Candidula unifasciata TaxID=100452 RepID=A0A8S4ADG8_9EUPU|nr:unnamed protein product [Candidula unifasciata]
MATSTMRKLLSSFVGPVGVRVFSRLGNKTAVHVSTVYRKLFCHRPLSIAGTTVGISYSLFGFSFGGKDEEETDPLTELYRGARLAHMRQDLQKADTLYHEALKLADDLVKSQQITEEKFLTARTLFYDGLADIAMQTGQIDTAEILYKETMKGCLMQGMEYNHNAMVEMGLKLATIYAMRGQKMEAEEGYKFCLNAQIPKLATTEKLLKANDAKSVKQNSELVLRLEMEETEKDTAALLGMALSSYGRFLLYEKRYTEALPLFEKAKFYAEHTLGTNTDQYLVVLNDIATLYIVTKNLDKAEEVLKEGINLSEKHKLVEKAMLFCNLGAVYLRKGDVSSAIKQCQLGMESAKEFDHKMAFKMAEACLKKGASVMANKSK